MLDLFSPFYWIGYRRSPYPHWRWSGSTQASYTNWIKGAFYYKLFLINIIQIKEHMIVPKWSQLKEPGSKSNQNMFYFFFRTSDCHKVYPYVCEAFPSSCRNKNLEQGLRCQPGYEYAAEFGKYVFSSLVFEYCRVNIKKILLLLWKYFYNSYYYFRCYRIATEHPFNSNFMMASHYCAKEGGRLVKINSVHENDYIQRELHNFQNWHSVTVNTHIQFKFTGKYFLFFTPQPQIEM